MNPTQIRIHLKIPSCYHQEHILSRLISSYGLSVNIRRVLAKETLQNDGDFDLELQGNVNQICQGLSFLETLGVKVISKAGVAGDSWYY